MVKQSIFIDGYNTTGKGVRVSKAERVPPRQPYREAGAACRLSQYTTFCKSATNTDPTEGAFLAGLRPPTHSSLFKPPPSSVHACRRLTHSPSSQPIHTQQPGPAVTGEAPAQHTCEAYGPRDHDFYLLFQS